MKPDQPDLRVRRTQQLLQAAMLSLLQERDLEAIGVNDLCEKAMVHRTTFYKHYQDKYDLLQQSLYERFKVLSSASPAPEAVLAGAGGQVVSQHFLRMFQHIAEYRSFYTAVLSSTAAPIFRSLFENFIVETALARIAILAGGGPELSIPAPVLAQFSAGALVNLLIWWLKQKQPPTPAEMAQYSARLLNRGMLPVLGPGAEQA